MRLIWLHSFVAFAAILMLGGCSPRTDSPVPSVPTTPPEPPPPPPPIVEYLPPEPPPFRLYTPTQQHTLDGSNVSNVFMHAGSGNPETGLFGFQRKASDGRPRLHEGIDIAPLKRDKHNRPLDDVCAAAKGTIAYINRKPGSSSYGKYVVLLHEAPPLGTVYTLYAHLQSIETALKAGRPIKAGDRIGRMGNSPGFPMARAHLHFECGLINNNRFARWFNHVFLKRQPVKKGSRPPADHGNYHGANLTGMNPCDLYRLRADDTSVPLMAYLKELPIAFTLVCQANRLPDYFKRYPALWSGEAPFRPGAIRLSVSQEGIILKGSNEPLPPKGRLPQVVGVNTSLPGLLGRRYLRRQGASWVLTPSGEEWLEAFLY